MKEQGPLECFLKEWYLEVIKRVRKDGRLLPITFSPL